MYSAIDRHLNCFHPLAGMNNAGTNICMQVFVLYDICSLSRVCMYLGKLLLGYVVILCSTFRGTYFPKQLPHFTSPPVIHKSSDFPNACPVAIISFFFHSWVIFHWVYTPHLLYSFFCQWTFRLLSCLGYCKYCCSECWHVCIFFNFSFLWVCTQKWDCWMIK